MWYIRAMDYYSALQGNEILAHATVWVNLEDITLSEIKPVTKGQVLYASVPHIYM